MNALLPGKNLNFISIGKTLFKSKLVTGKSSVMTFYFSVEDGKVTYGQGDPPTEADFAIGGGIPLILNNLKYGELNLYSADAPKGLPTTGDPGEENRKFLLQRSNNGFPKQDIKNIGKSLIGFNDKLNSFLIISQQDNVNGMTLTEIRDYIYGLGYINAISFDGSDSATLVNDNSIVTFPNIFKNNAIPSGVIFQVLHNETKR